jgi:signal transduction histidine kinase
LVLLASTKISELTPKQLELLEIAASNNKRLVGLVKEMLNVARIQSGQWSLTIAQADLTAMVTELIAIYRPIAEQKQLNLTVQLPQTPLTIYGDKNLLRIVLKNILDNATKYTPSGGAVRVVLGVNANEIYYCVQDNGIGIPQELQSKVFEEFFRTKEAIQQRPDGYGIGLHFSKLIVERHQGTIEVASEGNNKGSSFTIHLPISLTTKEPQEQSNGTKTT